MISGAFAKEHHFRKAPECKWTQMTNIEIRKISSAKEWKNLARLYKKAFPPSERKPLLILLATWRKGKSDIWYAEETVSLRGGTRRRFMGFATTLNGKDAILIDYLAVRETARRRGIGSLIVRTLLETYSGKGFFVEIESVYESNAKNLPERMRRRNFYRKNGLSALHVVADVFGVQMELLGKDMTIDFKGYNDFYFHNYTAYAARHVTEIPSPEKYL